MRPPVVAPHKLSAVRIALWTSASLVLPRRANSHPMISRSWQSITATRCAQPSRPHGGDNRRSQSSGACSASRQSGRPRRSLDPLHQLLCLFFMQSLIVPGGRLAMHSRRPGRRTFSSPHSQGASSNHAARPPGCAYSPLTVLSTSAPFASWFIAECRPSPLRPRSYSPLTFPHRRLAGDLNTVGGV